MNQDPGRFRTLITVGALCGVIGGAIGVALTFAFPEIASWWFLRNARPAVGAPRSSIVHCASFDAFAIELAGPTIPPSPGQPNEVRLILSNADLTSLELHEERDLVDNEYWYIPFITVHLSSSGVYRVRDNRPPSSFPWPEKGVLRINDKVLSSWPGPHFFDYLAPQGEVQFAIANWSFEDFETLLATLPACSLEE